MVAVVVALRLTDLPVFEEQEDAALETWPRLSVVVTARDEVEEFFADGDLEHAVAAGAEVGQQSRETFEVDRVLGQPTTAVHAHRDRERAVGGESVIRAQ